MIHLKSQYLVYAIVALVVAAVAYWVFMAKSPDYMTPSSSSPSTTSQPQSVTVDIAALNQSGESGTVTLTEENGKTTVVLDVTGEPKGGVQPAHIHMGKCPTPGAVAYPLTNVVDGKSSTTIMATLDSLKAQFPLAINIHVSANQMSQYVSCGDLSW